MIQLHVHSKYSRLDGLISAHDAMLWCREVGVSAIACTDHGTLGGLVEWYREANKLGIKPILGYEAYYERGEREKMFHLTLLAKNRTGYDNLVKINNLAYENFYRKPRVNDLMLKAHGEGLICLTGCLQGYLPQTVINGEPDLKWFESMREDIPDTYIEVMNHGLSGERIFLEWAYNAMEEYVVGTTDAHYLLESHKAAHSIGLAISMNKKAGEFEFQGYGYHLHTPDLPSYATDRTYEIAAKVEDYKLGHENWVLPMGNVHEDEEKERLDWRLNDYLHVEFGVGVPDEVQNKYQERLDYEYGVVQKAGFLPYIKMVGEICDYVDHELKSVRGWGRGSAGGSLLVMLYNITKIDPIKWGLYFERFLNPDRISPPDIDLDFKPEDRVKVVEWMRKKYGMVYQIGTYTTLGTKEVIRSVARATDREIFDLMEYVPVEAPVPTVRTLMSENQAFIDYVHANHLESFIEVCMVLEGCPRNCSSHASGIVIDFHKELPFQMSMSGVNAGIPVSAYDMYSLEGDLKLTKFDILGVNTLSIVDGTIKRLVERNPKFSLDKLDLNDPAVYGFFNEGNTMGVFQAETHSFARIAMRVRPRSFNELVDLQTLTRPGCIDSGMTDEYIERKHGRKPADPVHPLLSFAEHQNLPLFQEQMMKMATDLAMFTPSRADTLRKAIGKKQKSLMDELFPEFIEGCIGNGMVEEQAKGLWELIDKSARYTWNKSHAVAYALISYWCMYLAFYYPVEFFCELLTGSSQVADSYIRRRILLSECRKRGITVRHPDLNKSERGYTVVDGEILTGISGIKFCGDKAIEAILEGRRKAPITDSVNVYKHVKKTHVNARTMNYLLKAGCFPNEYDPSLEDEVEALGYGISGRVIDRFPYCHIHSVGEILKRQTITDKRGNPMAFVTVETHDGIHEYTLFASVYQDVKGLIYEGNVLEWTLKFETDLVTMVRNVRDPLTYRVSIREEKADEFLQFFPSDGGSPNVFVFNMPIAQVEMSMETLKFIDENFGITSICCHSIT